MVLCLLFPLYQPLRLGPACVLHSSTMKITPSRGFLSVLALTGSVSAVEVVANSGCASSCIDDGSRGNVSDPHASSTQHEDLYCLDAHFRGSAQEAKSIYWQGCLSCEASSPSYAPGIHNDTENDVQMFLCKAPFAGDFHPFLGDAVTDGS